MFPNKNVLIVRFELEVIVILCKINKLHYNYFKESVILYYYNSILPVFQYYFIEFLIIKVVEANHQSLNYIST